jgi:hypothetical protein
MKRILALVLAVATAGIVAAAGSATPRSGALHVTKECSDYHGLAGEHCTITSSSLKAIPVGSTVVYADAAVFPWLDTDIVLYTRGANAAHGHVHVYLPTFSGTITFSGGTGQFKKFQATLALSPLGGVDFAWDGTYSYG